MLFYLAAPYAHEDKAVSYGRFMAVTLAAAVYASKGHLVFSSITHNVPLIAKGSPKQGWGDYTFWKRFDFHMVSVCDTLLVLKLPGWMDSHYLADEILYAGNNNKGIEYIEPWDELLEELRKGIDEYNRTNASGKRTAHSLPAFYSLPKI